MTLSTDLLGPSAAPAQVIRKHYATEMAVERTRLLYQGSWVAERTVAVGGTTATSGTASDVPASGGALASVATSAASMCWVAT